MEPCRQPIRIPDILSISRMVLSPPLAVALAMASDGDIDHAVPMILFAVILMTDVADGHLARRMGIASHRGMVLDVVADVILSTSSSMALAYVDVVPIVLPFVIMVFGGVFLIKITVLTSFRGGYDPLGRFCGKLTMGIPILVLLQEHTYDRFILSLSFILVTMMVVSMLLGTVYPIIRRYVPIHRAHRSESPILYASSSDGSPLIRPFSRTPLTRILPMSSRWK
ncbi:MAG: CDP-alcohol phosphatidyltransferase family protein [Candidatus Methanomethylophilaceae archaeon]